MVKLFRWTAPLIEVLFQVDYHRPVPVLHEPGGRQPAGHRSSAQDSPRRLQVRVLQSCWFLKLVFVPRVPYSVPGVFTLCTIFGRKPGFQVGYQWATHVPDTVLVCFWSAPVPAARVWVALEYLFYLIKISKQVPNTSTGTFIHPKLKFQIFYFRVYNILHTPLL